jgi:hypothetical protein
MDHATEHAIKDYIRNEEEEKQMGQKGAGRFSEGKIRHDLVPPWSLNEIARVYTYGTIKYDDDNWWKGLKWKKDVFGCILRHVWKWFRGEKFDDESGLHHMAHAAWNCIAIMEYERNGIATDDRVPYVLDLMDKVERNRRIEMWVTLATQGKDKLYNGLDTKYTFGNKIKKIEVQNNEDEGSNTDNN